MIDDLSCLQDLCYELRWTYKALIILISTLDVDLFWHRRHEKCRALCRLADLRTCGLADLRTRGLADFRTFADACRACMSRCQHKTAAGQTALIICFAGCDSNPAPTRFTKRGFTRLRGAPSAGGAAQRPATGGVFVEARSPRLRRLFLADADGG